MGSYWVLGLVPLLNGFNRKDVDVAEKRPTVKEQRKYIQQTNYGSQPAEPSYRCTQTIFEAWLKELTSTKLIFGLFFFFFLAHLPHQFRLYNRPRQQGYLHCALPSEQASARNQNRPPRGSLPHVRQQVQNRRGARAQRMDTELQHCETVSQTVTESLSCRR